MNEDQTTVEPPVETQVWKYLNWGPLFVSVSILSFFILYFYSPIGQTVNDSMYESLVSSLEGVHTRIILLVSCISVGALGFIPVWFYLTIFTEIEDTGHFQLDRLYHGLALFAPYLALSAQIISALVLNAATELALFEWDPTTALIVLLPLSAFVVVSAFGWVFLRWKSEKRLRKKLDIRRPMDEKAFLEMRLVDISC